MNVGFFLVVQSDVQHYLHASSLVRDVRRSLPGVGVMQLSDMQTPEVPGVDSVQRSAETGPLLDVRLNHYAELTEKRPGEWLLIDTDVSVRHDVRGVFDDKVFDVAVCDRDWPEQPQGEEMLRSMPFNTGVVFSRHPEFWREVRDRWRGYPDALRAGWMSEQRAVYDVVRSGRYRVKILPGLAYNYPPKTADDAPVVSALVHYKGNRKAWLTKRAYVLLSEPA